MYLPLVVALGLLQPSFSLSLPPQPSLSTLSPYISTVVLPLNATNLHLEPWPPEPFYPHLELHWGVSISIIEYGKEFDPTTAAAISDPLPHIRSDIIASGNARDEFRYRMIRRGNVEVFFHRGIPPQPPFTVRQAAEVVSGLITIMRMYGGRGIYRGEVAVEGKMVTGFSLLFWQGEPPSN